MTGLKRQTKSQLINIILRKDDREAYLSREIKLLKRQNENLLKRINDSINISLSYDAIIL